MFVQKHTGNILTGRAGLLILRSVKKNAILPPADVTDNYLFYAFKHAGIHTPCLFLTLQVTNYILENMV